MIIIITVKGKRSPSLLSDRLLTVCWVYSYLVGLRGRLWQPLSQLCPGDSFSIKMFLWLNRIFLYGFTTVFLIVVGIPTHTNIGIPITKIRLSHDRFIFIMEIIYLKIRYLHWDEGQYVLRNILYISAFIYLLKYICYISTVFSNAISII